MKKAIIYGAGNIYNQIKHLLKREYEVIAFVDDDKKRWNSFFDNIIILSPQSISQLNYDVIFVATTKYESVLNNLIKLKVNVNKIKKLTEYISKNEKGIFTSNNIKVFYNSAQDRCAINEIFENNIYNFKSYFQHIIILDIGMNIGAASLYFANMKNVYKVYCFEPFKSTFNKAIENFELNPDLKNKIIAFNRSLRNQAA